MSEEKKTVTKSEVQVGEFGIMPQNLDETFRLATAIARSGISPRGVDIAEKVLVTILTGMEAGLSPMQSLRSVYVVNGRPGWMGDAALALVRRSGMLAAYKAEEIRDAAGKYLGARVYSKRKDRGGLETEQTTTFTMEDAKAKGLAAKDDAWKNFPERKCHYRALGFNLKDQFSDVLLGLDIGDNLRELPPMREPSKRIAREVSTDAGDPLIDIITQKLPEEIKQAEEAVIEDVAVVEEVAEAIVEAAATVADPIREAPKRKPARRASIV